MTNRANLPWWETTDFTRAGTTRGTVEHLATFSFISTAIKEGHCVYEHAKDGNLLVAPDELLKEISKLGGKVISKSLTDAKEAATFDTSDHIFVWNDALLTLSFDDQEWIYIKIVSLNKDLVLAIRDIAKRTITQKTKGKAYVFVAGESGPELRQISGKAGIELERDNYTDKVLVDFDHVVKDLSSSDPCGRITIISGDPGTGKSFLIRGITSVVPNAIFVLVQPSMISDLMSPQFIPVLMEQHKEGHPIVLIIEDADAVLMERQADNMHSISSLLNLGDGLFGTLFDLRLIMSTNASKLDLDPAIIRDGRCCRQINVDELEKNKAQDIFNRLNNNDNIKLPYEQKTYPLANIYKCYNDIKNKVDGKIKLTLTSKVGFKT